MLIIMNYELICSTCFLINHKRICIKSFWESINWNDSSLNYLYVIDIIHGHATLRKKRRHIRYILATVQPRIFAPHFFTIEDFSLLEKSRDEKKVAAAGQGNFYWERRLGLFSKLCKESIAKLLVSLVHQFIWPSFTLVFTRNGIFGYSQKLWMRLTFSRTEAATIGALWKKGFLEISQNSQENTSARASFWIKLQAWGQQLY